jgi:hypothetical protein
VSGIRPQEEVDMADIIRNSYEALRKCGDYGLLSLTFVMTSGLEVTRLLQHNNFVILQPLLQQLEA